MRINGHVFSPLIWNFFKSLFILFFLVVSAYVFNESDWHWLLSDALHVAITMALELNFFWNGTLYG
jgi:hypothetical protein